MLNLIFTGLQTTYNLHTSIHTLNINVYLYTLYTIQVVIHLVQGVCKILISYLKRLRFYKFKYKNKGKILKVSFFRPILTKKSVREHRIVLMLDMKLFSELWRIFCCPRKCVNSFLFRSIAPQSQTTNSGPFFCFSYLQNFLNF